MVLYYIIIKCQVVKDLWRDVIMKVIMRINGQ